ncbi:DciA family protein [Castellaniella sp.]|uniref:DciA family protein n=1 Tax=Castellaniella sp. TaxID=1955812 RepID=UPI002A372670|nr:DciA family protein [Castellaniella sp.]
MATPPRRDRSSGTPAHEWLGRSPQGAHMMRTAHELLAVQAVLAGTLPPSLARQVRVARIDGPRIVVMVPGPAHAARLRQTTEAAARRIRDAGWPVEHIVVRIDAAMGRVWTKKPQRMVQPLGETALQSFEGLQRQVAPGPLADAIGRLLRHHRS